MIDTLAGGGAERVVVELVRRFDRSRFDVTVCVTRTPSLSSADLADLAVPVHVLARKSRFDGFRRLRRLIRECEPHVLHTHKEGSNTFGRLCGLVERVPVMVAHEHGLPVDSAAQRVADCVFARLGSHVIACSAAVGRQIVEKKAIPASRVHVIANGIDTDLFSETAVTESVDGLPIDRPVVAAICRLDVDKDIATLLRAVPETLRHVPGAQFVIAGDGPLRGTLEMLTSQLGIHGNVSFLGYRSDVRALLRQADVFVLSSLREGVPLSVLEAMAMGQPVVAPAVGGVPEVVKDAVTGFLVPASRPAALASALVNVLTDPERARAMGRRARIDSEQNHSVDRMAREIELLYENLLAAVSARSFLPTASASVE